jgi:hypothetical protein
MGERLAAEAYTRAQSYFAIPDVSGQGRSGNERHAADIDGLVCALEYYQYLDPLLILITVAQMQALDGVVGLADRQAERGSPKLKTSAPELAGAEKPPLALQRIWEGRKRALDLAFVPDEHRAAAMWPSIYQSCWIAIRDLVASPLYADCQYRIGESAWGLVWDLPVEIETDITRLLEAGLTDEEISYSAHVNESLIGAFTGMLLDVTFMRIACEGGSRTAAHEHRPESKQEESAETRAA